MSLDVLLGALLIMVLRIGDVSIGTFRIILINNHKKLLAAATGFLEVLIWITAMRFVFQNLDNIYNIIGYATGFAIGNIIGITLDQKIALGYLQLSIISKFKTEDIADGIRLENYGVTILPGEGSVGGVSIIFIIIRRRDLKRIKQLVESIDRDAFINIQPSTPYRGFTHGSRK